MLRDVAILLHFPHVSLLRLSLGLPFEALPPIAAIRLRSLALRFSHRAIPAFRAISDCCAVFNFFVLARPPDLLTAVASGLGFFASSCAPHIFHPVLFTACTVWQFDKPPVG